ncbi:MAG: chemotaxis protein CheD [Desulfuromonadales bacterium]|nr:chemotaxis protein CheD [Desulfuromonadales bacterium]
MPAREKVGIAACRVARAPLLLVAPGLGSCLGIVLYDPTAKVGGLAHSLLPTPPTGSTGEKAGKFVDGAILGMVAEMTALGADRQRLWARIAGGAHMFASLPGSAEERVGARNVRQARQTLQSLNIPLRGEDVGGDFGRTLEFDLATGQVRVRTVCGPQSDYLI